MTRAPSRVFSAHRAGPPSALASPRRARLARPGGLPGQALEGPWAALQVAMGTWHEDKTGRGLSSEVPPSTEYEEVSSPLGQLRSSSGSR